MSGVAVRTGVGAERCDEYAALEDLASVLTASGRYRVMRRFEPRTRYCEADGQRTRVALFVDVETTGLDPAADAIIQFAAVPFEYGVADGRIYEVGDAFVSLDDPGRPIPPEISTLTGITDKMVAGHRIDDAAVAGLLDGTALVVAHNARFDRQFLERRLPAFAAKPWACSLQEVPWEHHGMRSTKLEWLLMRHSAEFHEGHRADADCYAAIHLLATPLPCGTRPMAVLLRSCRQPTVRVWALQAPYPAKAALKARRYRWSDGVEGRPRGWYTDVVADRAGAECQWLEAAVYRQTPAPWRVEQFGAVDRYSARV